ncbi:hypothetical protein EMCRGX_G016924 [Ephydatia muelleri]
MAGKENRWLVLGDSGIVNFGPIDVVRAMSNPLSPSTCMIFSAVIAEVLLVTVVTTVVMYSSGMTVASCLPMKDLNNVTNSSYANETNHLFCPTTGNIVSGPRYLNDITTLFLKRCPLSFCFI